MWRILIVITGWTLTACSGQYPEKRSPVSDYCLRSASDHSFVAYYHDGSFKKLTRFKLQRELENNAALIEWYEPSYNIDLQTSTDENWPLASAQSNRSIWKQIGVPKFHARGTYGQNITVAVVDAGMTENIRTVSNLFYNSEEIPNNGIDDDQNGFVDDVLGWNFLEHSAKQSPEVAHGAQVADLIAGNAFSPTGGGVAPKAAILPLDFMAANGGTESDAVAAIDYAIQRKVNIINNSWTLRCSNLLHERYARWANSDVLLVNAAGNDGAFLAKNSRSSSNFNSKNFISVGSVDDRNRRAYFSNFGPNVVAFVPGVKILTLSNFFWMDGTSVEMNSGTSFSAAIVSGVAALVWSEHKDWSAQQVRDHLLKNTKHLRDVNILSF